MIKAWELIEQKGWCRNAYARDKEGISLSAGEPDACSFCALGAITRCYGWYLGSGFDYTQKLYLALGTEIDTWNDDPNRTKAEVVAKLKELDI